MDRLIWAAFMNIQRSIHLYAFHHVFKKMARELVQTRVAVLIKDLHKRTIEILYSFIQHLEGIFCPCPSPFLFDLITHDFNVVHVNFCDSSCSLVSRTSIDENHCKQEESIQCGVIFPFGLTSYPISLHPTLLLLRNRFEYPAALEYPQ